MKLNIQVTKVRGRKSILFVVDDMMRAGIAHGLRMHVKSGKKIGVSLWREVIEGDSERFEGKNYIQKEQPIPLPEFVELWTPEMDR